MHLGLTDTRRAYDGVPRNVAYRGDLFRIKPQAESEQLVVVENRYLVSLFANPFIEGYSEPFPDASDRCTGDRDKVGLGFLEYRIQLRFCELDSLLRSAFHEAAGAATAVQFTTVGVHRGSKRLHQPPQALRRPGGIFKAHDLTGEQGMAGILDNAMESLQTLLKLGGNLVRTYSRKRTSEIWRTLDFPVTCRPVGSSSSLVWASFSASCIKCSRPMRREL